MNTDPKLSKFRGKQLRTLVVGERARADALVDLWHKLGYEVMLRDGHGMLSVVLPVCGDTGGRDAQGADPAAGARWGLRGLRAKRTR